MKIIIAGGGVVGRSVASLLTEEGHDITIIDRNAETVRQIADEIDVFCVQGSATNPEVLREAGIEGADLLLAATQTDEVNMLCGVSGRRLGAAKVIARIRDPEYMNQTDFLRETLGLDLIVNPELECAREISRILRFPGAAHVDVFSRGRLELAEQRIPEGSRLDGLMLKEIPTLFKGRILIGVVERDGEVWIPRGDFVLHSGDRIHVTGEEKELRRFFTDSGKTGRAARRAMIMGGGRIAVYLARRLKESGIEATLIEIDRERCERICNMLPGTRVICGDATYGDVLQENGLGSTDAFVALTGDDGDNITTSMYARSCGVPTVVLMVNRGQFTGILEKAGLDSVVAPKELLAQQMVRYVRALNHGRGSCMESLYRIADGKAEAAEFCIGKDSRCVGVPLKDLKLKPNVLVAGIIRDGHSMIPDGNTVIQSGDHVIIIAGADKLQTVERILRD